MKELGGFLKSKRIEKGMELQEIADITKISVRYLEGIEKGDWSMMPGKFYVKGFIRSYAKVLQVDVSSFLADIDHEIKQDQLSTAPIAPTTTKPVKANRFGKLFALSLVIILIIAVIATIIHYVSNVEGDGEAISENNNQQENTQNHDIEFEVLPEKEQPITEPEVTDEQQSIINFVEQQETTYIYEVSNVEQIEIRIEAVQGDCWYEIRTPNAQGGVTATNTLRNGNTDIVGSDNNTRIRLGNPGNVNLYINDQLIEKEATSSPRNFQFNFINQ
ncbi:helix-turn-helix domain-containing protein [Desulfuribacillus alkaliarsenatis]|uniref:Cytoskeleton protein RodZ-like C-terminal domain-containing protein n=1 Tax=Desulfuribacillus alkaliarsenatis TaxID=766136 RepID=A0A1E5G665_9FIRM|nr:RodZ domain-containing protein [Desulfuribacillus alkaliarsenatis]OEF98672.1 hypothetical protein BHF68_03155 [Desulfuribacillus alkaliarsenatis]